jgi:flagellar basal body-associated protein FliL
MAPVLATAAILIIGLLAALVILTIGIHAEGNHISSNNASHSRAETAARRVLGVYVRRTGETTLNDTRR